MLFHLTLEQAEDGWIVAECRNISGKEAFKALARARWAVRGRAGSHVTMPGTLRKWMRAAGLTVEEFPTLL